MRATFDIPDDLYRQIAAKAAEEERPLRELALELFRAYLGTSQTQARPMTKPASSRVAPAWFGRFKEAAQKVESHDMEAVRSSIARGIARERNH